MRIRKVLQQQALHLARDLRPLLDFEGPALGRKELVKLVHQRSEEARIAVRNCRRDALDHLRKAEKDGGISQEDEKRSQERLQKLTDGFIKRVEEVSRHKETEVLEV